MKTIRTVVITAGVSAFASCYHTPSIKQYRYVNVMLTLMVILFVLGLALIVISGGN